MNWYGQIKKDPGGQPYEDLRCVGDGRLRPENSVRTKSKVRSVITTMPPRRARWSPRGTRCCMRVCCMLGLVSVLDFRCAGVIHQTPAFQPPDAGHQSCSGVPLRLKGGDMSPAGDVDVTGFTAPRLQLKRTNLSRLRSSAPSRSVSPKRRGAQNNRLLHKELELPLPHVGSVSLLGGENADNGEPASAFGKIMGAGSARGGRDASNATKTRGFTRCQQEGCAKRAYFGPEKERKAAFCSQHKLPVRARASGFQLRVSRRAPQVGSHLPPSTSSPSTSLVLS